MALKTYKVMFTLAGKEQDLELLATDESAAKNIVSNCMKQHTSVDVVVNDVFEVQNV